MNVETKPFGVTRSGEDVVSYEIVNANGLSCRLTNYGATLVSMVVPDRAGVLADVVLGFDGVEGYQSDANQYFGCTTGRVANRIAKGEFELNGERYELAVNNGPNHLHGGAKRSLDKVVWDGEVLGDGRVRFRYVSPHLEEGYPGRVTFQVTYALNNADELVVDYRATTDVATPINLTNHAYWNLRGHGNGTVLDHELTIFADQYTPADDTLIPTGVFAGVVGTPLDFTMSRTIGARLADVSTTPALGYDHNYVLRDAADGELRLAARLHEPDSGRTLEIWTTEPGLQFYSGNHLNGARGKAGEEYRQRGALCLEAQHFPNAINEPRFPSIVLQPDFAYRQTTVHKFSVD